MAFRLEGTSGTWILPIGDSVIGRGDDCGVHLADPRLSRHHARLHVMPPHVVVHDLGSANGVLVNGDRILAPTALLPGDDIVCGPLRLRLLSDEDRSPSGVRSQPVTETLRGLIGERAADSPHRSRTEQMDGEAVAHEMALARQRAQLTAPPKPASKLNSAIAAALSTENAAPGERHDGSTSIRPSEMMPAIGSTSALSPNRFHDHPAPPSPHGTASWLPSEAPAHASAALEAGRSPSLSPSTLARRALWRIRLLAGIGDPLWVVLLGLANGMAVALIGVTAALAVAGSGIADDKIVLPGAPRAALGELAIYVASPAHWGNVETLARQLHAHASPWPFLMFVIALALGAVVTEFWLVWGLVAASVYHGGPWLHRRFGLHLVVHRNGHNPGWLRALIRWTVLAVTWPLAPVTAALGIRGLHDLLSGCEIGEKHPQSLRP